MAKIELKNISKRWKDFTAVENVSLTIYNKEFMVLLGPSGCGKTTTMRMIAGLEEPTTGEVWIDGKNVTTLEPKDRDIAMVFQSYGLYAHLNVYENIRFPLKVRKKTPSSMHHELVMRAAKMVQLEDFLKRKPKALSGGQRQRVALARAIVRTPNAFLMDEPLSNLDAKLRASMRVEIRNLQTKLKTTTVYVTHDQVEAMTMADRVAVMRSGQVEQLDTPEKIYARPANTYVAQFIGAPPMNLLTGEIKQKNFVHHSGKLSVSQTELIGLKKSSGWPQVILGVRPEDFFITTLVKGNFKGTVFSVEAMGNLTLVGVSLGEGKQSLDDENSIIISTEKNAKVKKDETVGVGVGKNARLFYCNHSKLLLDE